MKIAAYQFAGGTSLEENYRVCTRAAVMAEKAGASCLVLPEAAMYLRESESDQVEAQSLSGEFVQHLSALSLQYALTIIAGMFVPSDDGRVYNTLVVLKDGALLTHYHKLHLYDAFSAKESERIAQGMDLPPLFAWQGLSLGLMTCYDLRFPEVARSLAERGADVIILPAAWFAGEEKLNHWRLLSQARALENGVYLLAVDMCGTGRVGHSLLTDPMGRVVDEMGEEEGLMVVEIDRYLIQKTRARLPLLSQRRFKIVADF